MNIFKKNILHIFVFLIGIILTTYGIKLYSFGINYKEKSIRSITLVDTSSTTYKHKRQTFYNTTGYFVDDLTGHRFRYPIQDKIYREFESGGNQPIQMKKNLSQENLDNNVHGTIWTFIGGLLFVIGCIFFIWVLISKFFEYKERFLYFLKYGNQNE